MHYNPSTGKRIKDETIPGRINWLHTTLKRRHQLPKDWQLTQCLFGEHLLPQHPNKTVALVESDKTAIICGPPIMIKFTLAGLQELGFDKTQVFTTMELKMKCGVGKCGRCNIGSKYVCKDGPVFRCDQLDELPNEY